jgi:hypothetical protein
MTEQVWPKKGGDGTSVALLSLNRDSFASARSAQGRAVGWLLCAESCHLGRAQRWRDAAARVPALVSAAPPSAAGSCGAGDTQKNFADLGKAVTPEHVREKPIELRGQDEARLSVSLVAARR